MEEDDPKASETDAMISAAAQRAEPAAMEEIEPAPAKDCETRVQLEAETSAPTAPLDEADLPGMTTTQETGDGEEAQRQKTYSTAAIMQTQLAARSAEEGRQENEENPPSPIHNNHGTEASALTLSHVREEEEEEEEEDLIVQESHTAGATADSQKESSIVMPQRILSTNGRPPPVQVVETEQTKHVAPVLHSSLPASISDFTLRPISERDWRKDRETVDVELTRCRIALACFGLLGLVFAFCQNQFVLDGDDPMSTRLNVLKIANMLCSLCLWGTLFRCYFLWELFDRIRMHLAALHPLNVEVHPGRVLSSGWFWAEALTYGLFLPPFCTFEFVVRTS
jgi:hypothetical protein